MRIKLLAVLSFLLVAPLVRAGESEWYVLGQTGKVGDCMMEWRLKLACPSARATEFACTDTSPWLGVAPADEYGRYDGPVFGKNKFKVKPGQACRDGDPTCDADLTVNNRCQFRVGMCFCVKEPNTNQSPASQCATGNGDCRCTREAICNPGGTLPANYSYNYPEPGGPEKGIYFSFATKLGNPNKPWRDRSVANLEGAMLGLAGVVAADVPIKGQSAKVRLSPSNPVSGALTTLDAPTTGTYPRRDGTAAQTASCTSLVDVHVPLTENVATNGSVKFTKATIELLASFTPENTVDKAGDKLNLTCVPSADKLVDSNSLSTIRPSQAPNNYCWDGVGDGPNCPAPPASVTADCGSGYFAGCRKQTQNWSP